MTPFAAEKRPLRAGVPARLTKAACPLQSPVLYPLWAETLPVLARRPRIDLLANLQALREVIFTLGGAAAVAETARAIQDVGRWWL